MSSVPLLEIYAVFAAPLDNRQWAQVESAYEELEVAIEGLGTVADCEQQRGHITITFDFDTVDLLPRADAQMRATLTEHVPVLRACASRTDVGSGWSAWSDTF